MKSPLMLLAGIVLMLGGVALSGTGVFYLIQPPRFETTARIRVVQPGSSSAYDPLFMKREVEAIQCPVILTNVIAELNLNEVWGKRNNQGRRLSNSEVEKLLKVDCRLIRNTELIDITAGSESSPVEAMALVNAVTENYRRISAQSKSAAVTIVMPPTAPFHAVSPNRPLCMVSIAAGVFMAIGGIFCLKESTADSEA